jgi:hypothetical protein
MLKLKFVVLMRLKPKPSKPLCVSFAPNTHTPTQGD